MHVQSQSGALAAVIMPCGSGHDRKSCASPAAASPRCVTDAASDEALVARVADGDRRAIRLLLARHQQTVYHFVLRLVVDRTTAEDIVSEVFIELWRQAEAAPASQHGCWQSPATRRSRRSAR
jgi:hypothetical protein